MSQWNSDAGEIHKRLVKNHCPKCDKLLQIMEMNQERITRYCVTCRLTIVDRTADAEMPDDICD